MTTTTEGSSPAASTDSRYDHDRFVVRQKLRPLVNKYVVSAATGSGPKWGEGKLVAFVQEKRMSMRGKITAYGDESKQHATLYVEGNKTINIKGAYTVYDRETNEPIGTIKRRFGASIFLKSTWEIADMDGKVIAVATEKNVLLALARRYMSNIVSFFPYSFTIIADSGAVGHGFQPNQEMGTYTRRWGLKDVYDFDLTNDPKRVIDRRLAVALSIALDALEGR